MNDIESNFDQDVYLKDQNVVNTFNLADRTVEVAIAEKSPNRILDLLIHFREDVQIRGLAMAKLLSRMEENWGYFVLEGGIDDDFYDRVQVDLGLSKQTVQKYIRLWRNLFENTNIEQRIKDKLTNKPVRTLLLLSAAAKDGDIKDWDAVASSVDYQEIRTMVRKQRGERTSSKTSIAIVLDRDGTLKCRKGNMPFKPFGFLNTDLDDPIIREAIEKLIERAGIVEK